MNVSSHERSTQILLASCLYIGLQCGAFGAAPATIEELAPEIREQVEQLYRELVAAKAGIVAAREGSSKEDPLFKLATRRFEESSNAGEEMCGFRRRAKEHYQAQGPKVERLFKQWYSLYYREQSGSYILELAQDPNERGVLSQYYPALLREHNLIPQGDALSDEEFFEEFLAYIRQGKDKRSAKLVQLTNELKPNDAARSYARLSVAACLRDAYDAYIQSHRQEAIEAANDKADNVASELTKVWPNWSRWVIATNEQRLLSKERAGHVGYQVFVSLWVAAPKH